MDTLEVKCPGCKTILIVNKKNGKVIESRKPLLEESTGDRFEDARKRVEGAGDRITQKVEAAKKAEKEKMAKLEALFKEKQKEIEESDDADERPENIWDRM